MKKRRFYKTRSLKPGFTKRVEAVLGFYKIPEIRFYNALIIGRVHTDRLWRLFI